MSIVEFDGPPSRSLDVSHHLVLLHQDTKDGGQSNSPIDIYDLKGN